MAVCVLFTISFIALDAISSFATHYPASKEKLSTTIVLYVLIRLHRPNFGALTISNRLTVFSRVVAYIVTSVLSASLVCVESATTRVLLWRGGAFIAIGTRSLSIYPEILSQIYKVLLVLALFHPSKNISTAPIES